jgi:hypothetical protein
MGYFSEPCNASELPGTTGGGVSHRESSRGKAEATSLQEPLSFFLFFCLFGFSFAIIFLVK